MTAGVYSIYGSLERPEYGTEKGRYGHTRQLYKKGQEMDSGAVLRSSILKLQALHLGSTDAEILCLLIEHCPMIIVTTQQNPKKRLKVIPGYEERPG